VRHNTFHNIDTTLGLSESWRPRGLALDRLGISKAQLDAMLMDGTARCIGQFLVDSATSCSKERLHLAPVCLIWGFQPSYLPLPSQAHSRLTQPPGRLHDILNYRPRPCLSSHPGAPERYAESGHHDTIWFAGIPFHVFRLTQRCACVPAIHGRNSEGLDFCFAYIDDILLCSR